MSTLITLSCPSCGGKLDVSPSTPSFACQYCGAEHIVRREAGSILLEAFAGCPVCHRNDRVRKVSGIASTASELAWRLSPPEKPQMTDRTDLALLGGLSVTIGGLLVLIGFGWCACSLLSLFTALPSSSEPEALTSAIVLLVVLAGLPLAGGIAGLVVGMRIFSSKRNYEKKGRERVAQAESLRREAMKKWERLYYCERDDIVFDRSDNTYASADEVRRFVYQRQGYEYEQQRLGKAKWYLDFIDTNLTINGYAPIQFPEADKAFYKSESKLATATNEHYCIFKYLNEMLTPDKVRSTSEQVFRHAEGLKTGNVLYCYPVIVTDDAPSNVRDFIRSYKPKRFSKFEFPVIVELSSGELYYYTGTPLWGFAMYGSIRNNAELLFRFRESRS
jgi:predicted RNA-binding Zn-ribbon protein involved in translation (DUF1610 family)